MKDEQIKAFGKLLNNFCGTLTKFCKEFGEVTGETAPEVTAEDSVKVTEEVPTPAPVDDPPPSDETPAPSDVAEESDEEIAEVKEDEVNKDLDSIKDAVDEVAESDVEESAETLKKAFSALLASRDKLFASATRKNFSEVKDSCDKLFSAAEGCQTYTARRKARRLFDCIKFFADTVEEVLNETEEVVPAPAPTEDTPPPATEETPVDTPPEEPVTEDFAACPKCGKDPCECHSEDGSPAEFESPELDEAVESFADKIPEENSDLADFCGNLMNFACIATSKEDADRKIRFLKAFSAAMDEPAAETDAANQDKVDPEIAEEMKKTEEAEAKIVDKKFSKLVEFSKLLRQSTGISKEVIKSFSSLMAKFAEEEEAEKAEPENTPPADKPEEKPAEETPPPTEEPKSEEEPPAKEENPKDESTSTEDPEDSDDDDEEVVIDKTEVANFSQSGGDAYGDYMKKMLLR